MAYREFQTAAAHVVHLVQPSHNDISRLASDFHLHPLDLEAIFGVATKPHISQYREYLAASLPWPMLDNRHEVVLGQFQIFIGPKFFVIADDGLNGIIDETLSTWEKTSTQTDPPIFLASDMLLALVKQTTTEREAVPAANWSSAVQPLVEAIQQLCDRAISLGWLDNGEQMAAMSYVRYSLRRLAETTYQPVTAPVRATKQPSLEKTVTGYAIASAIMTTAFLLFLSFRR